MEKKIIIPIIMILLTTIIYAEDTYIIKKITSSGGTNITSNSFQCSGTDQLYNVSINNNGTLSGQCSAQGSGATADGNNYTTGIYISGTTTKNITLTRSGMINISAIFTDIDTDDQTCGEVTGCVAGAITDGNIGWDNQYGFYNSSNATQIRQHINNSGEYNITINASNILNSNIWYLASNPSNYITDGNTNWDNSYNFINTTNYTQLDNRITEINNTKINVTHSTNTTKCDPTTGKLLQINWSNGVLIGECGTDQTGAGGGMGGSGNVYPITSYNGLICAYSFNKQNILNDLILDSSGFSNHAKGVNMSFGEDNTYGGYLKFNYTQINLSLGEYNDFSIVLVVKG